VIKKSLIGMGYYGTITPKVILRNVLENPGWYTAYTPYQAEIAQGRLEALLNYPADGDRPHRPRTRQRLAARRSHRRRRGDDHGPTRSKVESRTCSSSTKACFPQTIDVVRTRAHYFGYELVVGKALPKLPARRVSAHCCNTRTRAARWPTSAPVAGLKAKGAVVAVASDLLALVLLKSPAPMGADIALGSAQRFGVPMGFGGPHAAFFATREAHVRSMPGRIIGVSKDARGKTALRMTLQTREQHIRREKANSNICTSQVLLANMAGLYAVYHGPQGLRTIAARIHRLAATLAAGLRRRASLHASNTFFDTLQVETGTRVQPFMLRPPRPPATTCATSISATTPSASVDETTPAMTSPPSSGCFGAAADVAVLDATRRRPRRRTARSPAAHRRHPRAPGVQHPPHRARDAALSQALQNRDLALDHSMISLGSCTMKLNATSEMIPVTWPEFADMHPFAPARAGRRLPRDDRRPGRLVARDHRLRRRSACSPTPAPRASTPAWWRSARYHASRGDHQPQGLPDPEIGPRHQPGDRADVRHAGGGGRLRRQRQRRRRRPPGQGRTSTPTELAALMITYPSTHGVFEEAIREICAIVHQYGGQVYMDGANLNAQVGLTSPATSAPTCRT
jgi:glycine dehydrogenase